MVVYLNICQSYSASSSHPLLPALGPPVHSLCLHLYSCLANRFISTIFLDSRDNIYLFFSLDLFYSVWQTLDSSTSLQMTQFCCFLCLSNFPLHMYHILFICSSIDEQVGCSHVLAIVNSAALIFGVQVSFWIMIFSGCIPNSGITGLCGSFIPS